MLEVNIEAIKEWMDRTIAESQKRLKHTGDICEVCGNPGASAQDETDHNTGDCRCKVAQKLCWREWWKSCQPKETE
jgi:hypothetical protein